jgi:hypothetical protein
MRDPVDKHLDKAFASLDECLHVSSMRRRMRSGGEARARLRQRVPRGRLCA